MTISRKFIESRLVQGTDEVIAYYFYSTPWGSSPANVTLTLIEEPTGTDVTSTKTTGSPTIDGDKITLPAIYGLEAETLYRALVSFEIGSNTMSAYTMIKGED